MALLDRRSVVLALLLAACGTDATTNDDPSAPDYEGPSGDQDGDGDVDIDDGDTDGDGIPDVDPEDDNTLPTYPVAHPRIYLTPNRGRLEAALAANTPAASRFRAKVDQWMAGSDIWGFQAWNAALMSQLTGDTAYCTKAVSKIETQVAAAEAKIASGAAPVVAGDSYLEIGELVGDLALVYDWCFDQVSASQRNRWMAYANQAIWNVWHPTEAKWGTRTIPWSGWSVNNPSNNYYYSFLRATMLVGLAAKGETSQADEWIEQFREAKIMGQLIPTFDADLSGGGSREGTGYGVAMRRLFELYDFWKSTTGESLATKTPHTRSSMRAFMHQIVPTFDRVAPTGDHARDATGAFFDYHRNYLQELITLFPNDPMAGPATTLLDSASVPQMGQGFMLAYDFLYDSEVEAAPLDALASDYYAPGIGELYSRSSWDADATWINLIAGPYTESHAHQDQGSLMVFKGSWLAHDAIVHSRSGLPQETTAHGLVRIDSNGSPVRQIASTVSSLVALRQGPGWLHAAADVTPAYNGNAAVQLVQRELVYLKPNVVIVFDRVRSAAGTTQTWQLPTPVQPAIAGATATITSAGHALKLTRVQPSSATMTTHSYASGSDFTGGYRLDQRVAGGDQRYLHVLSLDGAATSVTASGSTGVTVSTGGHTATVVFERDSAGATLTLDGVTTTLDASMGALD
jgi:hypothetical protein